MTRQAFTQCDQCWQPATCKKYGCRGPDRKKARDDIAEMLRTPMGSCPPSKWELAGAAEIDRLRAALQKVANLPLAKTETYKRKPDPIVRARRIAVNALKRS